MSLPSRCLRACLALFLLPAPRLLEAQAIPSHRVEMTAGGALLTSGAYFSGPGDLALAAGDALLSALVCSSFGFDPHATGPMPVQRNPGDGRACGLNGGCEWMTPLRGALVR